MSSPSHPSSFDGLDNGAASAAVEKVQAYHFDPYVLLSSKLLEWNCIPSPMLTINFFMQPVIWRRCFKLAAKTSTL
jgi:hypothetical protein